ncbi:MAG TPA: T9SS type A sorting domain-containing protein [Bacteroidia bacterium]|nr:T9SS type A sorting domain-containing protein [Bacteroidia bacterium]
MRPLHICFRLLLCVFFFTGNFSRAQTLSAISYPQISCSGTCPSQVTLLTYVSAAYFDSTNEVIYLGGKFNDAGGNTRNGLAAVDAVTGSLLPLNVNVGGGEVLSIAKSGDTLFIGGTFSSVNSMARKRIAALSAATGNLLPAFSTGTSSANDSVNALLVLGGKLYAGGKFSSIENNARTNIACFSVGGAIQAWMPSPAFPANEPVRKFGWYSGNIVVLKDDISIDGSDLVAVNIFSGNANVRVYTDVTQTISDFAMRGSVAYFAGPFQTVNGYSLNYAAACDLSNGNLAGWNPSIAVGLFDTRSRFSIAYYRDSLYIGVMDASSQQPQFHRLYVSYYNSAAPSNIRVLKTYSSNLPGLNGYYHDHLLIANARMIEIERYAQHTSFPDGTLSCEIYSWCLKPPPTPGAFVIHPLSACPGDTNVMYSIVPQSYFSSYVWTSNTPDIVPSGNTANASVDFSETFSGGAIKVYGVTSCGTSTPAFRTATVAALPVPDANAGNDDTVSCFPVQHYLHGSSLTPGASFEWNGPSGNFMTDSLPVTVPGTYVLTIQGPNGCRKRDTALVIADTLPPVLVPFGSIPPLTCRDTTVLLDAASLYGADSLYWSGPGLSAHNDPALVSQMGNFLLTVSGRRNGCASHDTLFVAQDLAPPPANVVAQDSLLTCRRDSVLLDAFSADANAVFQWSDSSGNYFSNPYNATHFGIYQLHATDTVSGCTNSSQMFFVDEWTTPPGIDPLPDSVFLDCSYSSLTLHAFSQTAGASFSWNGPSSFSATDSAVVTQQGNYSVTAENPLNGCTTVDSVYAGFAMTLDLSVSSDTVICPGSGAVLQVFPIGGTAPFSVSWNNNAGNSSPATVYPADTTLYVVAVTDHSGCTGTGSVVVNVPDPIDGNVVSFQPCDPSHATGQLQVHCVNGVPPYAFSIDNGLSWNSSGVFGNLAYGTYILLAADAIGCTWNAAATIDTASLRPAPEFLVSTSPQAGDTIVIVDISNPRPDSVRWDFPPGTVVTDSSMFAPAIIPGDTGNFSITMHAFFGSCEEIYSRLVRIEPFDSLQATPWNDNGIDSLVIYPNPNNGVFTATVLLGAKQDFILLVYDANGTEMTRAQVHDSDEWTGQISVPGAVPGNYVLRVIAEYDARQLTFVIAQ